MTCDDAEKKPRVLIAGGAAGIGLACAEVLAARGADLILCDVDEVALSAAAERLHAFSRFCDSIEQHSVGIFADELAARFGTLDVLINAAGNGYVRALAMMRMARACMPLFRAASGRRLLINVGPTGGIAANDGGFSYASSAGAFERLSEALAEQVKGTPIEVVTIAPILRSAGHSRGALASHFYGSRTVDNQRSAEHIADLIKCVACRNRPDASSQR